LRLQINSRRRGMVEKSPEPLPRGAQSVRATPPPRK